MHRFFVTADLAGENFDVREAEFVHQISRVLRMQPGEKIILLDNSGDEADCEITEITKKNVASKILARRKNKAEPQIVVTLFQAVPKNSAKFEEIVKNCTAIGISKFVPIFCERSTSDRFRRDRLEKIIRESAEQSERGRLPALTDDVKFEDAVTENFDAKIIGDSFGSPPPLSEFLPEIRQSKSVAIFVGPEGGFSRAEIEAATAANVKSFSLGKRILRTETAGAAIASAIFFSS